VNFQHPSSKLASYGTDPQENSRISSIEKVLFLKKRRDQLGGESPDVGQIRKHKSASEREWGVLQTEEPQTIKKVRNPKERFSVIKKTNCLGQRGLEGKEVYSAYRGN